MSDAQSQHRNITGLRPWRKGESGNPSGRPKGIEARAREHTDQALETLVRALDDPDRRIAITAAGILLDRGWGRCKQTIQNDPENPVTYVIRGPSPVESTQEWLRLHAPMDAAGVVIDGAAEPAASDTPPPPQVPAAAPQPPAATRSPTEEWLAHAPRRSDYS
jgi:hypothetical protein